MAIQRIKPTNQLPNQKTIRTFSTGPTVLDSSTRPQTSLIVPVSSPPGIRFHSINKY
jgi:hypothetical protein